ncbi:MAG: SdrD B-like domain-containing protein [Bacteroidota bacterium]
MNKIEKYHTDSLTTQLNASSICWLICWGALLWVTSIQSLQAQGRYLSYPIAEGQSAVPTSDGGLIIVGRSGGPNSSAVDDAHLTRLDADGLLVWSEVFGGSNERDDAISATINSAGESVGAGSSNGFGFSNDVFVFKADANGRLIWQNTFGGSGSDRAVHVTSSPNGGYLLSGCFECFDQAAPPQLYLVRIDEDGNRIWARTYNIAPEGYAAVATDDGGFAVAAVSDNTVQGNLDRVILLRIDADGNTLWNNSFGNNDTLYNAYDIIKTSTGFALTGGVRLPGRFDTDLYLIQTDENGQLLQQNFYGGTEGDQAFGMTQLSNGGFALTGFSASAGDTLGDMYLVRTMPNGDLDWELFYGNDVWEETGRSCIENPDGSLSLIGTRRIKTGPLTSSLSEIVFLKMGPDGRVGNRLLQGVLREDANNDCQADDNEAGLGGWTVELTSNQGTLYATTNDTGYYEFLISEGDYQLSFVQPNAYWDACTPSFNLQIDASQDTFRQEAVYQAGILCPELSIDLSADQLQPCRESNYHVRVQNRGTITAEDAYAEIEWDPQLQFLSASRPFTRNGSLYRFDLGDLAVGASDSFVCRVLLDCNAITGQTHCVEANIYPDSICLPTPTWDLSSVSLEADCRNDSLLLQIQNTGAADMTEALNFIIVEDQIVDRTGSFQLLENEAQNISLPALGKTIHLKAQQTSGHPGRSFPAISVEGCGRDAGNDFSRGFVTMHAEDDADVFRSIDCQESVNGLADFEKRAYPKGLGDQHLIYPNTDLEFHLYFQNNGQDTIRRLVIRDTLSPLLDIRTIRPGASSHPYRFQLNPDGDLRFVLDSVELLPASIAPDQSTAFVKYRVGQGSGLVTGNRIQNQSAAYLPSSPPILSGDVFHQIDIPQLEGRTNNAICEGENFMGFVVQGDTLLRDTIPFGGLFDSLYVDSVTALEVYTQTISANICQGERYEFQGLSYDQTGLYAHPLRASNGCDSTLFLDLLVIADDTTRLDTIIRSGDLYKEVPYFADSILVEQFSSSRGCDSIVITEISVLTSTKDIDPRLSAVHLFPNPMASQGQLQLELSQKTRISMDLSDPLGRRLRVLMPARNLPAGTHRLDLQMDDLPAGMYHLNIRTDRAVSSHKLFKYHN